MFPKGEQTKTKQNAIKMMRLRSLSWFLGKREVSGGNRFQGQLKDIMIEMITAAQCRRQLMLNGKGKETQATERMVNSES